MKKFTLIIFTIFKDSLFLAGSGLVYHGTSLIYKPAAFIVLGLLLVLLGYPKKSVVKERVDNVSDR